MSVDPDELYTLRNLFWLGHYQLVINESNGLGRLNNALTIEKDEYVYRSYLALGQYDILMSEIKDTAPLGLRAIRLLCAYTMNNNSSNSSPQKAEECMQQLNDLQNAPNAAACTSLQYCAATMWLTEDNSKEALKCVYNATHIELRTLAIQILLRMNQVGLAKTRLSQMRGNSQLEDHTLTKLATCWVILADTNKSGYQEAVYKYEEFIDKYTGSALLLNGLAMAEMLQGDFAAAETHINEALTKSPAETESLANLVVVQTHLQRPPELINRTIGQLSLKCKNHPLVTSLQTFDGAFDRIAA